MKQFIMACIAFVSLSVALAHEPITINEQSYMFELLMQHEELNQAVTAARNVYGFGPSGAKLSEIVVSFEDIVVSEEVPGDCKITLTAKIGNKSYGSTVNEVMTHSFEEEGDCSYAATLFHQ